MHRRKNLLIIVLDCLRSDAVFSDDRSTYTPNLDRLCALGRTYPNTITSATYTTPSFASLLTGLYPSAHGVRSLGGTNCRHNARRSRAFSATWAITPLHS